MTRTQRDEPKLFTWMPYGIISFPFTFSVALRGKEPHRHGGLARLDTWAQGWQIVISPYDSDRSSIHDTNSRYYTGLSAINTIQLRTTMKVINNRHAMMQCQVNDCSHESLRYGRINWVSEISFIPVVVQAPVLGSSVVCIQASSLPKQCRHRAVMD